MTSSISSPRHAQPAQPPSQEKPQIVKELALAQNKLIAIAKILNESSKDSPRCATFDKLEEILNSHFFAYPGPYPFVPEELKKKLHTLTSSTSESLDKSKHIYEEVVRLLSNIKKIDQPHQKKNVENKDPCTITKLQAALDGETAKLQSISKQVHETQGDVEKESHRLNQKIELNDNLKADLEPSVQTLKKTDEFANFLLDTGKTAFNVKMPQFIQSNEFLSTQWNTKIRHAHQSAALYQSYSTSYLNFIEQYKDVPPALHELLNSYHDLKNEFDGLMAEEASRKQHIETLQKKLGEGSNVELAELQTFITTLNSEKANFDKKLALAQEKLQGIEVKIHSLSSQDGDFNIHALVKNLKEKMDVRTQLEAEDKNGIQTLEKPVAIAESAKAAIKQVYDDVCILKAKEMQRIIASVWNQLVYYVADAKSHLEIYKTLQASYYFDCSNLFLQFANLQVEERSYRKLQQKLQKENPQFSVGIQNLAERFRTFSKTLEELKEVQKTLNKNALPLLQNMSAALSVDWEKRKSELIILSDNEAEQRNLYEQSLNMQQKQKSSIQDQWQGLLSDIERYKFAAEKELKFLKGAKDSGVYAKSEIANTVHNGFREGMSFATSVLRLPSFFADKPEEKRS